MFPHVFALVKRIDGIDILEEDPLQAGMLAARRSSATSNVGSMSPKVLIQVSFRKDMVTAERVAEVYREELVARRMRFGVHSSASMDSEFVGNRLYFTVGPKRGASGDGACFPSPRLVEHYYRGLLEEFNERLSVRGRSFMAANLVPASVAFLLRASGGIQGRKEIHRLLNNHVYGRETFVEDGYANSGTVQLWRDVPKAGTRIARTLPLFWGRPLSKHFADS